VKKFLFLSIFLVFASCFFSYYYPEFPEEKIVSVGPCSVSEVSECRVVLEDGRRITIMAPVMEGDRVKWDSFWKVWRMADKAQQK